MKVSVPHEMRISGKQQTIFQCIWNMTTDTQAFAPRSVPKYCMGHRHSEWKKNSLFIWNSNGAGCFVFYLAALAGRLTRRNKEATKASIYPSWKERNFHACPWSALRVDVRLFAVWEACCSATGSSHPHPQVHLGHPGQPGSQSSHKTKQILLF